LQQIADEFAAAGFVAVLADYHRGFTLANPDGSIAMEKFSQFISGTPISSMLKDLDTHVWPLLVSRGVKKFGALGLCAGSTLQLVLSGSGKLSAGASCHPSHARMAAGYGLDPVKLVEDVKCPQLLYPAKDDGPQHKPGGAEEAALRKKPFGAKNEIKEFDQVKHGFLSRGPIDTPEGLNAYTTAMAGLIAFFNANLV